MNINLKQILTDLNTDLIDIYNLEFPDFRIMFSDVVKGDLDEKTLYKAFSKFSVEELKEKFSVIYDKDIKKVDLTYIDPNVKLFQRKVIVKHIKVEEYEEFFEEFSSDNPDRIIKHISTSYNSRNDTIIFSAIVMER
jgi:hypothetical protein